MKQRLILAVFLMSLAGFLIPEMSKGSKLPFSIGELFHLPQAKPVTECSLKKVAITNDNPRLTISESAVEKTLYVIVTAYSSTPDQTDSTPFITATGNTVRDGIVAANFLPFGAQVRFPNHYGNKIFTVDDRMHWRFAHRVDIWMPTRQEAEEFGVKILKMEVLKDRDNAELGYSD